MQLNSGFVGLMIIKHHNYQYNGDNYEMLIKILYSFISRSISIITDCCDKFPMCHPVFNEILDKHIKELTGKLYRVFLIK